MPQRRGPLSARSLVGGLGRPLSRQSSRFFRARPPLKLVFVTSCPQHWSNCTCLQNSKLLEAGVLVRLFYFGL